MANYKNDVDDRWLTAGPEVTMRGEIFRLVPPEEMIWAKLYVMQKDRTDWPDVLNILYAQRKTLNWRHLLERLGEDAPLLYGLLTIFRWLCPNLATELPAWLWRELEKAPAVPPLALDTCPPPPVFLDPRVSFHTPLLTLFLSLSNYTPPPLFATLL